MLDEIDERDLFMLRKDLAGWRVIRRLTIKEIGNKVHCCDHAMGDMERGRLGSLSFSNIQLWCKSLDLQLMYKFDGLALPIPTPEMELLDKMASSTEGNTDPYDRMLFIELLKQLRWQSQVSAQQVADVVGIKAKSVTNWEGTATDLPIARAYGYVRAVGGRLKLSAAEL